MLPGVAHGISDSFVFSQKLVSRTKQYVGVVSPGQTFRESYERAREASMGSKVRASLLPIWHNASDCHFASSSHSPVSTPSQLRLPDYWANLIDSEYERIWEGYHRRMRESRVSA